MQQPESRLRPQAHHLQHSSASPRYAGMGCPQPRGTHLCASVGISPTAHIRQLFSALSCRNTGSSGLGSPLRKRSVSDTRAAPNLPPC